MLESCTVSSSLCEDILVYPMEDISSNRCESSVARVAQNTYFVYLYMYNSRHRKCELLKHGNFIKIVLEIFSLSLKKTFINVNTRERLRALKKRLLNLYTCVLNSTEKGLSNCSVQNE